MESKLETTVPHKTNSLQIKYKQQLTESCSVERSTMGSFYKRSATHESSPTCNAAGDIKCTLCARLPYRCRDRGHSFLFHSRECLDVDFGLFEIINRIETNEDEYKVDNQVAERTADNAQKHVKHFRKQLSRVGLLRENQNFSGETSNARVVAPFARSELKVGRLLGSGGFSSVYEVEAFEPDSVLSSGVTQQEDAARKFLTNHALRKWDDAFGSKNKDWDTPLIPRYAIKHLRHQLTHNVDRFERAAIDLTLEGQLLLAIDHPNIISIRGWSYEGPDAYKSGRYADYFLIIDRLPESLDHRIELWRHQLRKYRSRLALPWAKKKYASKVQRLLRERLQAAHDIASAIEYLHDRRIINRDIKTANIGFDVHGDLKIFDFGLSRLLPNESEMVEGGYAMSPVGTRVYMAPEVRNKKPYNLSADVYNFGVVLWELMSLSSPRDKLARQSRAQLEEANSTECWLPICPCWPPVVQDLIQRSLSTNPAARPSIGEIKSELRAQMAVLGMEKGSSHEQRRRSTFRLDLSAQDLGQVCGSVESKTSHTSSFFESEEFNAVVVNHV